MKNYRHRATVPSDEYLGQIFKIEMMTGVRYDTIDMGTHLFTDDVNLEVTIRQFNGNTRTYGMGHTRSHPASIDEIQAWLSDYWQENV